MRRDLPSEVSVIHLFSSACSRQQGVVQPDTMVHLFNRKLCHIKMSVDLSLGPLHSKHSAFSSGVVRLRRMISFCRCFPR
jgi:hypothetical protein